VINVSRELNLSARVLARVVGVSETSVSRMMRDAFRLEPGSKPFEIALLLIRMYRSLDSIVGGDGVIATQWLNNANTALGGQPIERIQTVSGLIDVIAYLDARRAIV
jgi:Protein of unknown function (DUF2384)